MTRTFTPMKLIVMDRNGTLCTGQPEQLGTPTDWQPLPGALQAVARLNQAGYAVVLAANYPGLGGGLFDMTTVNAVHAELHRRLATVGARIEAVFFCPHTPDEDCTCRKPRPGLLRLIGSRFGVDLRQVHAVGNSLSDLQAAEAAGCLPHLVLTGPDAPGPCADLPARTRVHADLAAFADALLLPA